MFTSFALILFSLPLGVLGGLFVLLACMFMRYIAGLIF